MSRRPEFSVWTFFSDGTYEAEARFVYGEIAVRMAKALTGTVGARIGALERVIITDSGDHTVFEWTHEEGITFPRMCLLPMVIQWSRNAVGAVVRQEPRELANQWWALNIERACQ